MENKRYKKEQDIHLTKEEYLAQLKKYLKRLPKEDYNNAMDYFTEYFEDAGPEGEAALIQELGTPKEAAYEILDNLITEKRKDPDTPIWKIIFLTFLSICAAPIGGALALTIIALALAGVYCSCFGRCFSNCCRTFSDFLFWNCICPRWWKTFYPRNNCHHCIAFRCEPDFWCRII